ncbi:PqiC family protein [Alteromonas sp. CYL-A6]|uniref:PqiC family protein n=1 Tax=Alteromonas nitratireducens TaxID=3390813 RepID=UPI0034C002FC
MRTYQGVMISLVLLLLSACTSSPSGITYYLLHAVQTQQPPQPDHAVTVNIRTIVLPDYLNKPQLALQTSPSTLHYASAHAWAETPENGVVNELAQVFRHHGVATQSRFARYDDTVWQLDVHIDDFIPTWQGEVILKGAFTLVSPDGQHTTQTFDYRKDLREDGFAHSVEMMRDVLDSLAQQISRQLKQTP